MLLTLLLAAAAFSTVPVSIASGSGDWPRWRGPDGTNVSLEQGWDVRDTGVMQWRVDIGVGYSTPIVARGAVYVVGYFPSEADPNVGVDRVSCLDAETGAARWSIEYPSLAYANEHRGGVIETPTLHGDTLYVATRKGELRALELATGATRWNVDLAARHGLDPGRYGFASSPLIDGERLVVNMASTVALDPTTGATLWFSENLDANYSTAAPIELPGAPAEGTDTQAAAQRGYAIFGGNGVFVVSASDGKVLRRFVFRQTPRNVEGATPIVIGTDVFVSSGYDQGAALIDMAPVEPVLRWRSRRMRTKLAGATLFEGHLYGHDESMLTCMDMAGEVKWRERGLGQGALSIAGDKLLLTTSEGELAVAEASPTAYVELSRAPLFDDDGVYWATPVLVNGRVFVRSSVGALVCIDRRIAQRVIAQGGAANGTVASPDTGGASGALPAPDELERRHLERSGLARRGDLALTLTGKLHVVGLGLEDVRATWGFAPGGRWHASFDLPPGIGGTILQTFDGQHGWETNPYRGDKLLTGPTLEEHRRTRGQRDLFDPVPEGFTARCVGREVFRGVPAFRVELEQRPSAPVGSAPPANGPAEGDTPAKDGAPRRRTVYFDAASGHYLGRTAADEATVVLGDWRVVEGVMPPMYVPFRRTTFEPETGLEHRWTFQSVSSTAPTDERFAPSEALTAELEKLKREGGGG
jgi:outer membrane protein assembly factor BamB